jgi:catechol 2,3-dioxygenase-like lactoylglutathione lyase family enzyme
MSATSRFAGTTITVKNLDSSTEFYTNLLGMKAEKGTNSVKLSLEQQPGSSFTLELVGNDDKPVTVGDVSIGELRTCISKTCNMRLLCYITGIRWHRGEGT